MLAKDHLRDNIALLLEPNETIDMHRGEPDACATTAETVLTQETILALCEPTSLPQMKHKLKYDYSDNITDVNSLCT